MSQTRAFGQQLYEHTLDEWAAGEDEVSGEKLGRKRDREGTAWF